jgi:alkylation response protein AidB-like acyl-CoA dehydrogenase
VNEGLGGGFSYSVAIAAHTASAPAYLIFWYRGTKQKYIPNFPVVNGKEHGQRNPTVAVMPGAKTSAKLSADGKHYIVNGQKCWITNGGFADIYWGSRN